MKKKLYIETSVWNQLYQDDRLDFKEITEKFMLVSATGVYDLYISDYLFFELEKCEEGKRKKLRMDGFNGVNILNGYGEIRLITPEFFIPEETNEKDD